MTLQAMPCMWCLLISLLFLVEAWLILMLSKRIRVTESRKVYKCGGHVQQPTVYTNISIKMTISLTVTVLTKGPLPFHVCTTYNDNESKVTPLTHSHSCVWRSCPSEAFTQGGTPTTENKPRNETATILHQRRTARFPRLPTRTT